MDRRSLLFKSISCRGVKCFNLFQKPSYYAVISIARPGDSKKERKKQKTPVSYDGGENPEWDLIIRFDLDEGDFQDMYLEFDIKCRGKRVLIGDKLAGKSRIPFTDLTQGNHVGHGTQVSYQVLFPDGKPNGVISFSYVLTSSENQVGLSPLLESAMQKETPRGNQPLPSAPSGSHHYEQQRQDSSLLSSSPRMTDSHSLHRPQLQNPDIHHFLPADFCRQTRSLIPDSSSNYPNSSGAPPSSSSGYYPQLDQEIYMRVFPGLAVGSIAAPHRSSSAAYGFPSPPDSFRSMNEGKSSTMAAPYQSSSAANGFPSLQDSFCCLNEGKSAAMAAPYQPSSAAYGFPSPQDSFHYMAAAYPPSSAVYGFAPPKDSFRYTGDGRSASFAASYHPSSAVLGFLCPQDSCCYMDEGKSAGFPPVQGSCCYRDEERSHHGY
ncbi:hypothetical protein HPP92_024383 [Vanilla planifolia]|uniref:C2 domain-containing protein n=1 Tax=Vanilla planifolia TaxID=51239 RepID=A0A835PJJ6_VANPL|nr:hypothetical protein HPP92_024383 [Vanilla planifolia]